MLVLSMNSGSRDNVIRYTDYATGWKFRGFASM